MIQVSGTETNLRDLVLPCPAPAGLFFSFLIFYPLTGRRSSKVTRNTAPCHQASLAAASFLAPVHLARCTKRPSDVGSRSDRARPSPACRRRLLSRSRLAFAELWPWFLVDAHLSFRSRRTKSVDWINSSNAKPPSAVEFVGFLSLWPRVCVGPSNRKTARVNDCRRRHSEVSQASGRIPDADIERASGQLGPSHDLLVSLCFRRS